MKIAVIGLGYVGLTVVGAAASSGFEVHAYDLDELAIQKTQEMITSDNHLTDGYLLYKIRDNMQLVHFSNVYDENLKLANVKFICVDTINVPTAVQMLAPYIKKDDIVIIESTISVHDCGVMKTLIETCTGMEVNYHFILAFVPERVMEGSLLQNFESMPRVIGTYDNGSFKMIKRIYEGLGVKGKIQYTDPQHATAVKDMENAFRFVEISIANEFADICREKGLDYDKIKKLVNVKGHEMGYNQLLNSGIGIGGPCIPMAADIIAKMNWDNANLLRTAIEMNMGRPQSIANAILAMLKEKLEDFEEKKIAVLGATYRPNGVDARDAPATEVIASLATAIPSIHIYDPLYRNGEGVVKKLEPVEIEEEFDAVVILVGHDNFIDLSKMKCRFFIDLTGVVKKYPKGARRQRLQV
jgi:UDP-N-acetyl-D-mannosaminuronic acid dehydrogenase